MSPRDGGGRLERRMRRGAQSEDARGEVTMQPREAMRPVKVEERRRARGNATEAAGEDEKERIRESMCMYMSVREKDREGGIGERRSRRAGLFPRGRTYVRIILVIRVIRIIPVIPV